MKNKIQEKEKIKTKSTIHNFDIIPLLRFLLWRNVLLSSLFLSSSHFLPLCFLLSFSDAHFCQSFYLSSTFSNSFLIYLNIPSQIFDCLTHTTALPYASPVIPFFCILPLLPLVVLLLLPPVQTLQSTPLCFSNFFSSPKYPLLL